MDLVAQEKTKKMIYQVPSIIPVGCFRTYDIRGEVAPDGLTENVAYAVGLAFGSEIISHNLKEVIVGRDGRLTGLAFKQAVCAGLMAAGCNVIDIGMVPSPVLYFATHQLSANSGIMITASHNPRDHNGFKMVLNGTTLVTEGVQRILARIQQRNFTSGEGKLRQYQIRQQYLDYILERVKIERPLKVVVDCGNGIAGVWVPELYRCLGCEVIELFCEVDGRFPNHHPDPTVPENLTAIIEKVKSTGADIGIAFDGDADRLGVVTNLGEIVWPDRQLMLYARDVLSRVPGANIVFDVKCSSNLPKVITQYGGKPIMFRTGHSILKAKMFEVGAPLAGEMSGHVFFKEGWFGFDDGLYVGARLLRILSQYVGTSAEMFAELPNSVNTPELKLPMAEDKKADFMQRLLRDADFGKVDRITIDGLRVEFGYGWGLVRPSGTSPYLILRFEADNQERLDEIKNVFRKQLLALDPMLELPF